MVAETGTVEDPADPARKAAWYRDAAGTLAQSMPRIRAVVLLRPGRPLRLAPRDLATVHARLRRLRPRPVLRRRPPSPRRPPTTARRPTTADHDHHRADHHHHADHHRAPTTTAPARRTRHQVRDQRRRAHRSGDDAQRVVDAHGAGTTYLVKAGTHRRNFSVQPKSGDTFCGEPGAVLDGGRSLPSAFSGGATNVTLDSITVQHYATAARAAAIQPDPQPAAGWCATSRRCATTGPACWPPTA